MEIPGRLYWSLIFPDFHVKQTKDENYSATGAESEVWPGWQAPALTPDWPPQND